MIQNKIITAGGAASWMAPGQVLLESHTASSSSTLDFTARNAVGQSGATFQTDYDTYVIEVSHIVPASDGAHLVMQCGTGGTPTWDTGANYSYVAQRMSQTTPATESNTGLTSIPLTSLEANSGALAAGTNWGVTGFIKLYTGTGFTLTTGEFNYQIKFTSWRAMIVTSGAYEQTTAITGVRFQFDSGALASGTIRIYGLAK